MSISTAFQAAIDLVDPSKVLSFVIDPGYENLEWSCAGLEVRGGSDMACNIGAAALLEAMGFRFYAPRDVFWKLPSAIPETLSLERGTNWISSTAIFLVYGHGWDGSLYDSRALLNDAYTKWAYLVGVAPENAAFPAGHRWKNVIESNPAFFAEHPQMIRAISESVDTFDLAGIWGTVDWDRLVHLCAAFLLSEGLNEFNRTNFDPVDGDDNPSDLVYPFTLAVVTQMRAGTAAIGGIAAQEAVPDAQIGVYVYAGHRLPPSQPYKPGVYAQVALAFNRTALSYADLIAQHGAKADGLSIRDYLDTQIWSQGRPMFNVRNKVGYFDGYDGFRAAGVVAMVSEFTANWLVNMPQARAAVLKCRKGVVDWDQVIAELVDDVFDADPAVAALYAMWLDPIERYSLWSLRRSFDLVDQMAEGWYRRHFEDLHTIYYQFYRCENREDYGIIRAPGQGTDIFAGEISTLLSWVTAIRDQDVIHSYAFLRQQANTALNDYPALKIGADPEPGWMANPVAPTAADFQAALTAIRAETVRDPDLDSSDLVLKVVAPVATPATSPVVNHLPATAYYSYEGVAVYLVLGPSTVRIEDKGSGEVSFASFGPGVHVMDLPGNQYVTWEGGAVFMDTFPFTRKDPDLTERYHWLYVPETVAGQVDLRCDVRWSFYDEEDQRKDWGPNASWPDLGPGQVAVHNNLTRVQITNVNCNRYLSPIPHLALMPRALARRSGNVSTITIVEEPED